MTMNLFKNFAAICAALLFVSCASREPEAQTLNFDTALEECDGDVWKAMQKLLYITKTRVIDSYTIEFSPDKIYTIPKSPLDTSFIDVLDLHDVTIDGMGATLEFDAYNGFLTIAKSKNIVVKNFNVICKRMAFTQGDVLSVNVDGGYFVLRVDKNYPLPPSDDWAKKTFGAHAWQWGNIFQKGARTPKSDTLEAFVISKVEAEKEQGDFKIFIKNKDALLIAKEGDRFVMPLPIERNSRQENENSRRYQNINSAPDENEKLAPPPMLANVSILDSSDVLLENINMSRTRMSGYIAMANLGKITIRNCKIFAAENDLISTWRYGMLFVGNKVGPIIDNCEFSGNLDDAIEIASHPAMIEKIEGERKYLLTGGNINFGNNIIIFYPNTGKVMDDVRIVEKKGEIITTDRPIPEVVLGLMRNKIDANATQIYNLDDVNTNFSISNCIIENCGRNAIAISARRGFIVANTIRGVHRNAVQLGNESDAFFAGPLAKNVAVVGNRISDYRGAAVRVGVATDEKNPLKTNYDISISENKFVLPKEGKTNVVELCNGGGVKLFENTYLNSDDEEISGEGTTYKGINFRDDEKKSEK